MAFSNRSSKTLMIVRMARDIELSEMSDLVGGEFLYTLVKPFNQRERVINILIVTRCNEVLTEGDHPLAGRYSCGFL